MTKTLRADQERYILEVTEEVCKELRFLYIKPDVAWPKPEFVMSAMDHFECIPESIFGPGYEARPTLLYTNVMLRVFFSKGIAHFQMIIIDPQRPVDTGKWRKFLCEIRTDMVWIWNKTAFKRWMLETLQALKPQWRAER